VHDSFLSVGSNSESRSLKHPFMTREARSFWYPEALP